MESPGPVQRSALTSHSSGGDQRGRIGGWGQEVNRFMWARGGAGSGFPRARQGERAGKMTWSETQDMHDRQFPCLASTNNLRIGCAHILQLLFIFFTIIYKNLGSL
jgi:hypothetical protein